MKHPIIIIGAGLSGLLTAYRLHSEGHEVKILEALPRHGGRIQTIQGKALTPMEMGATWIHPPHTAIFTLLKELNLNVYPQYMEGAAVYQESLHQPRQMFQIPQEDVIYRIEGGTQILIEALISKLPPGMIEYNARVQSMTSLGYHIELEVIHPDKETRTLNADQVILTVSPQIWARHIEFEPKLPQDIHRMALTTHTWMADSVKCAIEYSRPWWREMGLSGTLMSQQSPIVEFYDHSDAEEMQYALCGFLNPSLLKLSDQEQREFIHTQLQQCFGEVALDYRHMEIKSWSPHLGNNIGLVPHQNNGHPIFEKPLWKNRLHFAGTETAHPYGGYMEGAVISAQRVVRGITSL